MRSGSKFRAPGAIRQVSIFSLSPSTRVVAPFPQVTNLRYPDRTKTQVANLRYRERPQVTNLRYPDRTKTQVANLRYRERREVTNLRYRERREVTNPRCPDRTKTQVTNLRYRERPQVANLRCRTGWGRKPGLLFGGCAADPPILPTTRDSHQEGSIRARIGMIPETSVTSEVLAVCFAEAGV